MNNLTNNIITSVAGLSLLLLIGSGIKTPQLFDNDGYSNLTSLLVGGMLGVVTSQSQTVKEDDDYSIK
jgi:hypothetical protein